MMNSGSLLVSVLLFAVGTCTPVISDGLKPIFNIDMSGSVEDLVKKSESNGGVITVPLTREWGIYDGKIQIGTPPQEFKVTFEASFPSALIPDKACKTCRRGAAKYDGHKSSSHSTNGTRFEGKFVDNVTYSGHVSSDQFSIGGKSFKALFGEVEKQDPDYIFTPVINQYDGIMGLSTIKYPYGVFNLMVKQGLVEKPVYSFYHDITGGELTLGGVNPDLYTGDFVTMKSLHDYVWMVKVNGGGIGDRFGLGCRKDCTAVLSTYNPAIVGPVKEIQLVNDALGIVVVQSQNKMYCPHEKQYPDLTINIGGKNFTMSPEEYIIPGLPGSACYSPFYGVDIDLPGTSDKLWILGQPFFRSVYAKFDAESMEISLATPKKASAERPPPISLTSF